MNGPLTIMGFLDESCKPVRERSTGRVIDGQHYVVAGAVTLAGDLDELRQQLAIVEKSLGAPLHYSELTKSRRVEAAKAIAEIAGWEGHVFETATSFRRGTTEHHVRAQLLKEAFPYLAGVAGAAEIVLESRGHHTDGFGRLNQRDHDVFHRLVRQGNVPGHVRITHESKAEPVLALADLLAGARTDALCAVGDEPYVLLSHRVRSVRSVGCGPRPS